MESPRLEQVQIGLKNSHVTFSVVENNKVIEMARLLGDGTMSFYIKDFVIERH